jgi:hypothetical protein
MLTLDQSTLFYFSINSAPEPFKKGIKTWASQVKDFPNASKPNSKAESKAGSLKSQHDGSFITTKSTLVDHVIITAKVEPGRERSASPPKQTFGAFEDEDETRGAERDFAAASPIKGIGRVTSSVNKSNMIPFMY